jgi:diguanylate cyclase (GGDEF)-like protein/PAS domain S-box-containing protein
MAANTRGTQHSTELERQYRALLSNLPGIAFRCTNDRARTMVFMSEGCQKLTGYSPDQIIKEKGGNFNDLIHPDDGARVSREVEKGIAQNKHYEITYRIFDKLGNQKWVWEQGVCVKEKHDEYIEGFIQDVTERKRLEEETEKISRYDPLTWLPNRFFVEEFLDKLILPEPIAAASVGLLVVNIKKFKQLNDTYGLFVGDLMLKKMANKLKNIIKKENILARLENDKFAIIVSAENNGEHEYGCLANEIISALSKEYKTKYGLIEVNVSVGIALYPSCSTNKDGMINQAIHAAKTSLKNEYMFYNAEQHKHYLEMHIIEGEIKKALTENQFHVVYQPILDITTNVVRGVEALARWKHPTKGYIPPDRFIPIAEATDLIVDLERFIINQSFSDYHKIEKLLGEGIILAVNVSIVHLNIKSMATDLEEKLREYKIPNSCFEVELTETSFARLERNNTNIRVLMRNGCSLAIDDFGTGQSSLNRLYTFPFKIIKIDKFFVQNCHHETYAKLIRAILAIGKALDMDAIAEGVENKSHHEFLLREGCRYAQGFYYGKPMDLEKLLIWSKK